MAGIFLLALLIQQFTFLEYKSVWGRGANLTSYFAL